MLLLGRRFANDWWGRPPGLPLDDSYAWRAFIFWHGSEYAGFYYNVRLGEGKNSPGGIPEKYRDMWTSLTMLRADAIGAKGEELVVFEIKRILAPRDVFQVQGYAELLKAEIGTNAQISTYLVAEQAAVGAREQAAVLQIPTFILEDL